MNIYDDLSLVELKQIVQSLDIDNTSDDEISLVTNKLINKLDNIHPNKISENIKLFVSLIRITHPKKINFCRRILRIYQNHLLKEDNDTPINLNNLFTNINWLYREISV